MKYTFNLKEPKSEQETLILFSCYYKDEHKKLVFSTGEFIKPINWDFQNRLSYSTGTNKSKFASSIKMQLNRHSDLMLETESQYKKINEVFTSKILKKVFEVEFKKALSGKNIFLMHMLNLKHTRKIRYNGDRELKKDIKILRTLLKNLRFKKISVDIQ
jgi:hypothetical protein